MAAVRPGGDLGPLGFILPTLPQGKTPFGGGNTSGTTTLGGTVGAPIGRLAAAAEAGGAGALWVCDHLYWPGPVLECLTTVAAAATATTRVPVGPCVLQLPLRQASAVAKAATTLQLLSAGRLVLGVGVGSHPGEYQAAGVDYHRRGHLADQGLEQIRRAWGSQGRDAQPVPSRYRQLPGSPPVPVWVGGASDGALRRAARYGDGWIPMFLDPDAYGRRLDQLKELLVAQGRPADDLVPAVVAFIRTGESAPAHQAGTRWLADLYGLPPKAFARHLVAGPAEWCAERLEAWRAAGARHVAVMVADDDQQALEHFGAVLDVAGLEGPSGSDSAGGAGNDATTARPAHEMVGAG